MRVRSLGIATGAVLLIVTPGHGLAQAIRNAVERVEDRTALAADRTALADDAADLDRLSDLALRWQELRANGSDSPELREVQMQIAVELRRDLAENQAQAARAAKEARTSDREQARALLDQKRDVARQLGEIQGEIDAGRGSPAQLQARQAGLLDRYVELSRQELDADLRELSEDRRQRDR
jgi:hypothetical protein